MAASADVSGEIENINSEVQRKREQVKELNDRIDHYKKLISEKKIEGATLGDQINLIESQVAKTKVSIEVSEQEIKSIELQMVRLEGRIKEAQDQVERERDMLGSLVRQLHYRQSDQSVLEILLSHDTFSGFFDELYSVVSLERRMHDSVKRIDGLRVRLEEQQQESELKRADVTSRRLALEATRRKLEDDMSLKTSLLSETMSSELEYRYMLAELKREQSEADSEIVTLEKSLRSKMDLAERLGQGTGSLSWPVNPDRGLSTNFHDPDYPFRNVFEHPGIDIRAYQGTPIRAVASGIVGRAKNAGMGYSYVLLVHGNDLSSVYGHLSKITVKEDTFVERGEIIGYSGGMPGTPGAGKLTTGPHLHFEVRQGGIPVNPLNYLL
ncbi:MAG: peptidoglycan DD-metalloendopeptidase family protein [bacterium]